MMMMKMMRAMRSKNKKITSLKGFLWASCYSRHFLWFLFFSTQSPQQSHEVGTNGIPVY